MVYYYIRSEVTAKLLLVVGIIGSTVAIGYVTYVNDYPPVYLFTFVDKEFVLDFNKKRYQATYSYLGLYCVGLYLGTYMAQASKIQIKKSIAIICWIAAFAVGLTIVYAIKPWTGDQPYTMLEAICYSSLNRLGWGIALGWVILACFSGRGGVINDLLSWPGFQPLVRLAYIVYLTHCQVFLTYNYSLQGPQDASHITIVFDSLACLCISHIIAVFVRVIFEYPLLKIEDDVFKQFELRHAKKPEGGDTTIDLHNRIALNDDVNLIKVTNNQIQFANEYGKRNQNERTDKEVEETSLETN